MYLFRTFEEHLKHIQDILERLRNAGLTIEPRKTKIARPSIRFIGYILDKNGVRPDPANVSKVANFKQPTNRKMTRAYLGLTGFMRRFVENYAQIARPLQLLTHKTNKFQWNEEADIAFKTLQSKLTNAPTLGYVDLMSKEPLLLSTDASIVSLGYCLRQNQMAHTGKMDQRYLLYGGRSLTEQQRRWPIWELELLSIVTAFNKLDQFLRCKPFILICDSSCVTHLLSKDISTVKPRLARWIMSLRNYDYQVIHKPGASEHLAMADYISREPDNDSDGIIDVKVEPYVQNITTDNISDPNTKIMQKETFDITLNAVRESQRNDSFYKPMINYLINGELSTTKKMAERIENNYQNYIIINDLLYHIWHDKSKQRTIEQLCITEEHKNIIMRGCHDSVFAGHNGQLNTLLRVRENYYWQGMTRDCTNYVESCDVCVMANRSYTAPVPLQNKPIPSYPLKNWSIDLLSIATQSNKYKHIFVAVCDFSKLVIAKPMINKTGFSTAKQIFNNIILAYGIPSDLTTTSDSGPDMISATVQALYKSFNIKNVRITAYNSKANGAVERQNSTILGILRRYCMNDPKTWSQYLSYVTLCINSTKSSSTGYTPFELMHGSLMMSPLQLELPKPTTHTNKDQESAYQQWYTNLAKMREIASDILKYHKQVQKQVYDRKCKPHDLAIGDHVYVSRPAIRPGIDPKLSAKFPKKYTVKRFVGTTNVVLEDKNGKEMDRSMHINRLKKIPDRRVVKVRKKKTTGTTEDLSNIPQHTKVLTQEKTDTTRHITPFTQDVQTVEDNIHKFNRYIDNQHKHKVENQMHSQEDTNSSYDSDDSDTTIIIDPTEYTKRKMFTTDSDEESDQDSDQKDLDSESDRESVPEMDEETDDSYYPVEKIIKKRTDPDGNQQYLCKWQNFSNRHNTWVNHEDLNDETRNMLDDTNISIVTKRPTPKIQTIKPLKTKYKIIHNENDFLAFKYRYGKPIKQSFILDNTIHTYNAYTIEELYYCYIFIILGLEKELLKCRRNSTEYLKHLSDYMSINNIAVFNNAILFLTIRKVLDSKSHMLDKLLGSYGLLIIDNEGNVPATYAKLLLLYREDLRRKEGLQSSVDPKLITNLLTHIHGSFTDDPNEQYLIVSPIVCVGQHLTEIVKINLERKWIENYETIEANI